MVVVVVQGAPLQPPDFDMLLPFPTIYNRECLSRTGHANSDFEFIFACFALECDGFSDCFGGLHRLFLTFLTFVLSFHPSLLARDGCTYVDISCFDFRTYLTWSRSQLVTCDYFCVLAG